MKALIVAAFLVSAAGPAMAYCPTHNPYDPRCRMSDFVSPIGTVQWFMQNQFDRQTTLIQCRGSMPPPIAWCRNAMMAGRMTTGATMGRW